MKNFERNLGISLLRVLRVLLLVLAAACAGSAGRPVFDGQTLTGWEGDREYFRVEDGVIIGGTDAAPIPRNEFLCTEAEYGDFELELQFGNFRS